VHSASPSFSIVPRGPFDLRLLAGFGFGPDTGRPEADAPAMRLAFCRDDLQGHAGVLVRQDEAGAVHAEVHGDADVERQVARILSLDHDGEAWLEVGKRDPVIGELQERHPGLRPPLFHSPY
jgi:DNA-3-methyladenine glycosylase II